MGRHRDRKYGNVPVAAMMANGMSPYRPAPPPGIVAAMAMLPLMGFTAFIAGLIVLLRRKRVTVAAPPAPVAVAVPINSAVTLPTTTSIPNYAGITTTGIANAGYATSTLNTCTTGTCATGVANYAPCATGTCSTVGFNERLVAAERLPGVKVKEIDVVTRKKVNILRRSRDLMI